MNIGFTSMIWQDISEIVQTATVQMEDEIKPLFSNKNYGAEIDKFIAGFVAIGTEEENKKYSKRDNKVGFYKCPFTNKKIKFLSFALEFHPDKLKSKNTIEIKQLFYNALYHKLNNPSVKMPQDFDYSNFASDMKKACVTFTDIV